jgi:hypothetical protein
MKIEISVINKFYWTSAINRIIGFIEILSRIKFSLTCSRVHVQACCFSHLLLLLPPLPCRGIAIGHRHGGSRLATPLGSCRGSIECLPIHEPTKRLQSSRLTERSHSHGHTEPLIAPLASLGRSRTLVLGWRPALGRRIPSNPCLALVGTPHHHSPAADAHCTASPDKELMRASP